MNNALQDKKSLRQATRNQEDVYGWLHISLNIIVDRIGMIKWLLGPELDFVQYQSVKKSRKSQLKSSKSGQEIRKIEKSQPASLGHRRGRCWVSEKSLNLPFALQAINYFQTLNARKHTVALPAVNCLGFVSRQRAFWEIFSTAKSKNAVYTAQPFATIRPDPECLKNGDHKNSYKNNLLK